MTPEEQKKRDNIMRKLGLKCDVAVPNYMAIKK
jgi:hypothetical protein